VKLAILPIILGLILASAVYWKYQHDLAINEENYIATSHNEAERFKTRLQQQLLLIYQGIRTIANLPSVRTISLDDNSLDANVLYTIREIFDNLSTNVGLSSLYFMPSIPVDGISTDAGEFHLPLLVLDPEFHFNPGVNDFSKNGGASLNKNALIALLGKDSIQNSRVIFKQLQELKHQFPTLKHVRNIEFPAVTAIEYEQKDRLVFENISADIRQNDNHSLIYSVPFYGRDGDFKGAIAAIVPIQRLREMISSPGNVILHQGSGFTITPLTPGIWQSAMPWIKKIRPHPDLIYSRIYTIGIPDISGNWILWSARPDSDYRIRSDVHSTTNFLYIGWLATAIPTYGLFMFIRITRRQQSLVHQKNIDLEKRVNERTRALSISEEKYRTVVFNAIDGIITVTDQGMIATFNPAAEKMFGYTSAEIVGQSVKQLYIEDTFVGRRISRLLEISQKQHALKHSRKTTSANGSTILKLGLEETQGKCKNGAVFPMEISISEMSLRNQTSYVAVVRDITKRKQAEEELQELHDELEHRVIKRTKELADANEELEYQALHDALTDLPNRILLQDRLNQAILSAQRESRPLVLFVIDLDRFKEINDTLGHHYGDVMIQQVAMRLRSTLRESDTVARFGGDEFALLLPTVEDREHALQAARKIIEAMERPFFLEGQTYHIGISIGIAMFPEHGVDGSTLMRHADIAMYVAKRNNTDIVLYDPSLDHHSLNRLALMGELRHAIDHEELLLHYQPKIDIKGGYITEVEALVRWQHPERGLMMPDDFIPLAEQTGLIKPLSIWVIKEAMRQCTTWHRVGYNIKVAVNLSARNLHDTQLPDYVGRLMKAWEVIPDWLVFEITESAIMSDPISAMETLTRLHKMGINLSIDDFGTGYSSLSYLKQLPVNEIKIDKSFVMDMAHNKDDLVIVRSTIDLAHNMGRKVIAEGVETTQVWDMLVKLGCDMAQGNYISKPLSADKLKQWLCESKWGIFCVDMPWLNVK